MTATLTIHPAAGLFPEMSPEEFAGLQDDIAEHGQRDPIVVWHDQVIDGRHRLRACRKLGLAPVTVEYDGEISGITDYIISCNLHRRHLTTGQRALVATRLATLRRGANQHASIDAPSQSETADLLKVSRKSVQRAREVLDHGVPELVTAVEHGEIAVSTAAGIAALPDDEQRNAIVGRHTKTDADREKSKHWAKPRPANVVLDNVITALEASAIILGEYGSAGWDLGDQEDRERWRATAVEARRALTRFLKLDSEPQRRPPAARVGATP